MHENRVEFSIKGIMQNIKKNEILETQNARLFKHNTNYKDKPLIGIICSGKCSKRKSI